jgi:hypothetical protein
MYQGKTVGVVIPCHNEETQIGTVIETMPEYVDRMIIVVLVLALGYFAFDKFVLAPRRQAGLVASAAPNESKSIINAKSSPCFRSST